MNENINLTKILKDYPKGTKFYSIVHGEVRFIGILCDSLFPILVSCSDGSTEYLTADGKLRIEYKGECILLPSKEQRDWSKFVAPWYKKEKFDPKTLKPFDKVIVRDSIKDKWNCSFFFLYM